MSRNGEEGEGSAERPEDRSSHAREKRTDETWKEKAREEKEKLAEKEKERAEELPPGSFLGLVDELSFRVMIALGQVRPAGTEEVYIDLEGARYAIDLLDVLAQKTKGNLTREEETMLAQVLHNLRLLFVHVSRAVEAAPRLHDPARGVHDPARGVHDPASGGGPRAPEGPPGEKPGPKIIL